MTQHAPPTWTHGRASLAQDLHALLQHMGVQRPHIVGYDLGGGMAGAGHWIADEQPAALAARLQDFFARVEAGTA